MRALEALGHSQAILYGKMPEDKTPQFLDNKEQFVVDYKTADLPYPICGMSDIMPYEATRYRDLNAGMLEQFREAYASKIREAIILFKPDLLICHHLYLITAITASVVQDISPETPIVGICHGTDLRQMESHELERDFICNGIKSLNKIFVLHDEQTGEVESIYGASKDRVQVIGTGYNSLIFNSSTSEARTADSVLFVGKVSRAKGVESLLRSFINFQIKKSSATLKIVGGHSDEEQYLKIVELAKQLELQPDFTGVVSNCELVRSYRKSHVFVLPSFFEGLPLVSLEACACGCVCVMTALPGVREWYSENAPDAPILFVEPPAMQSIDVPIESELPSFEKRLTDAIEQASSLQGNPSAVEHLSWKKLATRLLAASRSV